MREGLLVLEDGTTHHGQAIGRPGTSFGEIVFNTAMSGYQEVLTDPSYAGQIVVMTAAHIGNYGVRRDEAESDRVHVAGFVARDFPERWSGTGGEESLASYLEEAGVTGLHGLDTRALVRHIRTQGAMRAGISTEIADPQDLLQLVLGSPPMIGSDLALAVSPTRCSVFAAGSERFHVAAIDYGMKRNIIRLLNAAGCRVTVFPATAPATTILEVAPDGIFLSNGPGDPAALGTDLRTTAVAITSQNHGFAVDGSTLPAEVEPTHRNLNDGTLEGFRHRSLPILAAQFHPEASPGPHDANVLFDTFIQAMERERDHGRETVNGKRETTHAK